MSKHTGARLLPRVPSLARAARRVAGAEGGGERERHEGGCEDHRAGAPSAAFNIELEDLMMFFMILEVLNDLYGRVFDGFR